MANNNTANPAVIIGLGGTGKWVLTYIKKNLLDTYGGKLPATVKLLSFDTTKEKKITREGKEQEEDVRVGDVQLDVSEFVYLGGNIREICLDIRDKGAYPHIGAWLQARTYLEMTETDAFDISDGAGQKRPFGRMAVFYNLQAQVESGLVKSIGQAITDVIAANERNAPIEIYIVASLSGGTGSGMVIDIAHLARLIANRQIRTGFAVRGFLALQNTFRSVLNIDQIEANTAAALRELDRFMLVFDQQYPIKYNTNNSTMVTTYGGQTGKLFDNCYLLDASRDKLPLDGIKPKYGVYPSIADSITMLLDTSTGNAYAEHYSNVNTRIGEVQHNIDEPIYSSLGTYSLILPVEDIIDSLSYRFALELLTEYVLQIQVEKRHDEHTQEQSVYEEDVNKVVFACKEDANKGALAFLRTSRNEAGIESTQFLMKTPGMLERNLQDLAYQREVAERGAMALLTWLLPPEDDPDVAKLAQAVREPLQVQLINRVQPSNIEGDDYPSGCDRITREVVRFKETFLGRESNGRRVGGTYRSKLEQCVELQKRRYGQLLHDYLIRELNGPDPRNKDFQQQRRGRLGYLRDFLTQLSSMFERLSTFFDLVRAYRAERDALRSRREQAAQLRHEMEETKNKGSLLGTILKGVHPAVKAQQAYLVAEQDLIDYEFNELLIEQLRATSEQLRQLTEEHKSAIEEWLNSFIFGYSGPFKDPGLYKTLLEEQARLTKNREEKKRIHVHEYVTDATYEEELYRRCTRGKSEEALARLVWIAEEGPTFKLTLPGLLAVSAEPSKRRNPTELNRKFFLELARGYFLTLQELTIAERLKQQDPKTLVLKLIERCGPLIRFDSHKQINRELHLFVCVNEGREQNFFTEFAQALRVNATDATNNQLLSAANPHTCTILATADVLSSYGILPYLSAEKTYNRQHEDSNGILATRKESVRLLHIFPAEIHAVEFEVQLPLIHEPRRKFVPRLTAMLEDRKRVEEFVLCYLYKLIKLESAGGIKSRYVLDLTLPAARRNSINRFELTQAERIPSLFTAMETFVFKGVDINRSEVHIDFKQVELARMIYEAQVMGGEVRTDPRTREARIEGGNESCLINLLEGHLTEEVQGLRDSALRIEKDLGLLMALIIYEIVEVLDARLRARGQAHDPSAGSQAKPSPSRGQTLTASQPGTVEERRAKLEAAHQEGILTAEELQAKLAELTPARMTPIEHRAKLEAAHRDGVLTPAEYETKLKALGQL